MMCHSHRSPKSQAGSALGNVITLLLLLALVGIGVYMVVNKKGEQSTTAPTQTSTAAKSPAKETDADAPSPIEPVDGTPPLEAAAAFTPKDNVLLIDISEYAGYGGLIVANGGLEPNADSFFAKEY